MELSIPGTEDLDLDVASVIGSTVIRTRVEVEVPLLYANLLYHDALVCEILLAAGLVQGIFSQTSAELPGVCSPRDNATSVEEHDEVNEVGLFVVAFDGPLKGKAKSCKSYQWKW